MRQLQRAALVLVLLSGLALLLAFAPPAGAVGREMLRSGAVALPLAAVLICWGALRATALVAAKRLRVAYVPADSTAIGRAARAPQAGWIAATCLPAAALAWWLRAAALPAAADPQTGYIMAAGAVLISFVVLIGERHLAAFPADVLPEAPALRAVAFCATLICFGSGLTEVAANLGLPGTAVAGAGAALLTVCISLELTLRAAGRLFLPPPPVETARAAVASLVARVLSAGAAEGGLATPLRQHFGLDVSRSWALAYARAATLPLLGGLLLLAWGLTGVVVVPLDGRAIYERFGAPVRVLHAGLHVGLPWPFGTARAVEYGAVHELSLGAETARPVARAAAEDPPPPSADRLWEQPHPGEIALLIAGATLGNQSFQTVSADLRVLYRVGLSDADAMRAAYAVAAPENLVRAVAGRVVARYFADQTLDTVLGADREATAQTLRARVQAGLDAAAGGLDAVALVIEAIHPPAGAAEAYHNVRAAQIAAEASVAVERGAAATIMAQSRQYAFQQTSNAAANGASYVETARTARLRFQADADAAHVGGKSFLLERYFAALTAALGHAPQTIIDSRLGQSDAPVLDLRSFAIPGAVKDD